MCLLTITCFSMFLERRNNKRSENYNGQFMIIKNWLLNLKRTEYGRK